MSTNLLSMQRSAVTQPGRVSQPRAHKCVHEKAELQAASLSPKHHAAHRQGEELMCSSWSSLGISQHSPGQAMNAVRFVAGQEWQLLLTWQKARAREMYSQKETGVPLPAKVKSFKPDLKMMYSEGSKHWDAPSEGPCSWVFASQSQVLLLQYLAAPTQQHLMALALPSSSSSCTCSCF